MQLFVPISELHRHVGSNVDLVGVVVEFSFFKNTSGTDYLSILTIVDNSSDHTSSQLSKELSVNIFIDNINHLPRIRHYGDVIVLRKVKITRHRNETSATFNKKFSEYGLIYRQSSHFLPYQTYGSFCLNWNEQLAVAELKEWWQHVKQNTERSHYMVPLKSISPDTFFDLVCKILHVCYDTTRDEWIVYVWDGTDVPPLCFDANVTGQQVTIVPLQIESTSLESNIIRRFERLGTVLRITSRYGQEYFGSNFPGIGRWVVFRNMQCRSIGGIWYGILNVNSRIRLLANDNDIVESCISDYKKRELEKDRLPLFYFANGVNDRNVQYSTLMDVVASEQDGKEFFCVVRVVALTTIQEGSNAVLDDTDPDLVSFKLTLEDATTRVHAILRDLEFVTFFEYQDGDVFIEKVKEVLGIPEHVDMKDSTSITRSPSWMECSLVTGKDKEGRRCYFARKR